MRVRETFDSNHLRESDGSPLNLKNTGISFIEVYLALTLLGFAFICGLSILSFLQKNQTGIQLKNSRTELINKIRSVALDATSLEGSSTLTNDLGTDGVISPITGLGNGFTRYAMLANCLPSITALSGCDKSVMDHPTFGNSFYLVMGNSSDVNKIIGGENIHYDQNAKRCTGIEAKDPNRCPFYAKTWFEPFCLGFSAACSKANSIAVRYAVGIRSDSTSYPNIIEQQGEILVSLQKGVQIKRLLDQNGNLILQNEVGIYSIPKYSPTIKGLQFEVLLESPKGMKNMKLQSRMIVGPAAYGLDDKSIPAALTASTWADVLNCPVVPLSGAERNSVKIIGSSTYKCTISQIATRYDWPLDVDKVGLSYLWTFGIGGPIPPTFQSGFYQFRLSITDDNDLITESANYATVRITPEPKLKFTSTNVSNGPSFVSPTTYYRDCLAAPKQIWYWVYDDEGLLELTGTWTGPTTPVPVNPPGVSSHPRTVNGETSIILSDGAKTYTLALQGKSFLGNPLSTPGNTLNIIISEYPSSYSRYRH